MFSLYKYKFHQAQTKTRIYIYIYIYMFIGFKSKALGRVRETALQQDVLYAPTGLHISWSHDQGQWPTASSVVGLGAEGETGPLASGTTSSPWTLRSSAN